MESIALYHDSETAIFGFWGLWLYGLVFSGGLALLVLTAYLVKKVKKKIGRRKD